MYPPSNNNCNYSSILSSSSFHIPSPSMQYEHELFLQSYHDQCYLQQQQQVPLIEDLSHSFDDILADSIETVTNPSNYTDNVKILNYNTETVTSCNHNPVLEGIEEEEEEEEEEGGNKGNVVMSSRTSIIRGRISKNKRSSNKDRHSKINTARGPRDRRMRLSLDVARKFFSLQDLLGFDKASKTVEWLLIKSESAIEDVVAKANNEGAQLPQYINKQISCSTTTTTTGIGAICASNSISECEVISGTEETSSNDKNKETAKGEEKKKKKKKIRKKKGKTARRAAFEPLARESRDRARARARERTKTKKISLIGKSKALANKTCEKQQQPELSTTIHQEKQLPLGTKENTVDNYNLVVNGNWNPLISIFNYQQNPRISHEHQFTDFQFCGKLWEA